MSFNLPRIALVSASVLTLSVLAGCSTTGESFNTSSQMASQNATNSSVKDDLRYDSYYGSPKSRPYQVKYQPKIKRTVTKPIFKVTAPKRYVVKKGDTFWDVNQKVKNPHRIYPGDVLHIYQGGKRRIKVADGSVVEKLVPQMRIERNGTGEPISTLSPFLIWPRALDENTINKAPYIVAGKDANLLLEKGQTAYAYNLSDRHRGGRYAIFHKGDKLVDPESTRNLGYEVAYTGFLEVDEPALGADVASATIAESLREIRPGDKLLSIKDETHTLNAPIQFPRHKVRGTIISLTDANIISGQAMVVTINKGARNGFKLGYTLGVYAPSRTVNDPIRKAKKEYDWQPDVPAQVSLPPERVATAIVYKITNDISYALVSTADHVIKNGYKIGNP